MAAAALTSDRYDLKGFAADIADIPVIDDPATVRLRSRDFFWFSPILKAELQGRSGDLVVCPRDEADVVRVARACARRRVPLTVRGAGTGNYGQAVPLAGGIVLDMSELTRIEQQRPGAVRVQPGKKLVDLDDALRPSGWEQRMHPSTKRTATIGGFVAGGSGGIGSVTYGGLREPGNILGARVVTLEPEPRVLELHDDAAQKVCHAYGTNGIITAVEMALAPVLPWIDVIVAFDRLDQAVAFGYAAALADGVMKKLVTPVGWPTPRYFKGFEGACPDGRSLVVAMIAEPSLAPFAALARAHGGDLTYRAETEEGPGARPLYELTWNHTTLHALKADKAVTYLQSLFPADRVLAAIAEIEALLGEEAMAHYEFVRFNGSVTALGLPLVRFTTEDRLRALIRLHVEHGVMIADPHVTSLEAGSGHMRADTDQLGFKHEADPLGLMNPGKMTSFAPRE
jgi:FAD/FMN-containing dehydrogenase